METVDLESNLYDMNTYTGRAAHFYRSVNPLNLFKGLKIFKFKKV